MGQTPRKQSCLSVVLSLLVDNSSSMKMWTPVMRCGANLTTHSYRFSLVATATALFVASSLSFLPVVNALSIGGGLRTGRLLNPISIKRPLHIKSNALNPESRLTSSRFEVKMAASSQMPHTYLDVSLDQPLLSPVKYRRSSVFVWKSVLTMLLSDAFKTAVVAFVLAFSLSFLARSSVSFPSISLEKYLGGAQNVYKLVRGRAVRLADKFKTDKKGLPMPFDGEDGWGVCTLRAKKRIGRSSYSQYDFDLPRSDYVLPLGLGQQVQLCCLDDEGNVAKGNFFTYSPRSTMGMFSIVAPNKSPSENKFAVGKDRANFARVLKDDMKVGDEVALKPGSRKLEYRGQYLPVTDMVYVASGPGVVPVIEQAKAVLPSGTSSVKGVSVIWINDDVKDFDLAVSQLESEYFKYSSKLAVSCIVDDIRKNAMEENPEIEEAIPNFYPGTMAVVSGPREFTEKAREYLVEREYPEDCICVLS